RCDHVGRLHAVVAKARRVTHALPRNRRLRRTPAQWTDRWCGVRDTLEGPDLPVRARNGSGGRRDDRSRCRRACSDGGRGAEPQENELGRLACWLRCFHFTIRGGSVGASASMTWSSVALSSPLRHAPTFAVPLTGRV